MPALDFPNSPSNGQTFTGNGKTWTWDGTSWNVTSSNLTLVAGSNQQVQFNDNGILGAHSGFTYNKTNSTATLGNLTLSAIAAASVGTDSFVVSEAGVLKYRTAAQVRTEIGAEPTITAGTTSQYYRGDKSWQTLNLQNVTAIGATTNQPITLTNTAGTFSVIISVDSNGNIVFNAGLNQSFHFSGDVVAFSALTPPVTNWWNSMPYATATTVGGIKIGSGLTIDGNGVLSASGGAGTTAIWGNITGTLSNQSDLSTALSGKANTTHTHVIADVTGLQTALDGKQPLATNLTSLAGLNYVSASFVKMTAAGTFTLDTNTYLTGNQSISISGDVSGSGTTAISLTLATVNSNIGTFNNVTVNAKGLVTAASNASYSLTTGTLAQFAATTSAQLASVISDKTGTGALVFGTTPTFTNSYVVQNGANSVTISVDANGNVVFTAGTNKNFHFSGDVVAFSSMTPPDVSWWTSMPYATTTTVGGVKVDGTTIIINGSGVISATGTGGTSLNGTGFVRMSGTTPSYITGTSSQFIKADGSLDSNTYLTSYTETDTLQSVTNRGSSSSNAITLGSYFQLGNGYQNGNYGVRLESVDNGSTGHDLFIKVRATATGGFTNSAIFYNTGTVTFNGNVNINPADHLDRIVIGNVGDASWRAEGIGGSAAANHNWTIAHNGSKLYFGISNGTTALLNTWLEVQPNNRNIQLNGYTSNGFLKTTASNGTVFVDTSTYLTSYTETSTLQDVTNRGASTTVGLSLSGGLYVSGGTGILTSGTTSITSAFRVYRSGQTPASFGQYAGSWRSTIEVWGNASDRLLFLAPPDSGHGYSIIRSANGGMQLNVGGTTSDQGTVGIQIETSGVVNLAVSGATVNGNTVWHAGNFTPGNYLPLSGGTITGLVTFPSAVASRPQMPGGILGLNTGDGNFDIWGISTDYYPSHGTAANAWGIQWNGDNNQVRFIGNGTQRLVIDLDGGSTGALTWEGNNIWHAGNLTNLNQLTNGPGYITSYTETDTLASVTARGATTATQVSFTKTDDHAISVGTIRGRAVGSQTGEFIHLYERVHIGGPNGWGATNTATAQYGLSVYGGANIGYGNNASLYAYAYRGNGNVGGTGEAAWFPAGMYSGSTQWLYGTMYRNGSDTYHSGGSLYSVSKIELTNGLSQNNIVGRPYAAWGAVSATGPVIISFPGGSGNYGMVHAVIDIYEYNSNNVCTIIIGGHNWSSQWYQYGANVIGTTNKSVRLGFKDSKYCIVIGDSTSTWDYGQVVLRKIQNGTYYQNSMDVYTGYTVAIGTDSYTWISSDLRKLSVPGNIESSGQISSNTINTGTISSSKITALYNTGVTGSSVPSYTNAQLELQTTSSHVPAIGFHRTGVSATTLYEYDGQLYVSAWTTRAQTGLLLSSGNYNSYAPSLSGSGAYGSWGINITGSASSASTVTINDSSSGAWYDLVWRSGNTLYRSTGTGGEGGVQIYAAGNYIRCQYINTTDNDESGITRFVIKNGDAYHRSATTTVAADVIRGVASGSWGINITGNAATATRANGNFYIDNNYGNTIVGLYSASRYQGVFAMGDSYKLPADGTSTGSLYGLAWSHPNAGGVAANLNTHGLLVMENGTFLAAVSGSIRARDDIRAPRSYTAISPTVGSSNWVTDFQNTPTSSMTFGGDLSAGGPAGTWWFQQNFRHSNSSSYWGTQIAWGWEDNAYELYQRNVTANSFGSWVRYLNTNNYNVYVPTLTGTGASGTWPISISGSSASCTGNAASASTSSQVTINYNDDSNSTYQMLWGSGNSVYGTGGIYCNPSSDILFASSFTTTGDWFRNNTASTGLYNNATGAHWYSGAAQNWTILSNASTIEIRLDSSGGNTRGYVYANSGNEIGFLNSAGGWSLKCDNSGNVTATGNLTAYSDISLKTDIFTVDQALDKVSQIRGVYFKRKDDQTGKQHMGVIAQEIEEIFPEVVHTGSDGIKTVAYGNIVGVLIEAIKELQEEVKQLKSK